MQIKFDRVTIHNFLSFGDATIELAGRGYTLVSGVNGNPTDSAVSNGAGKSTLFEAVSWSLTGETVRGVKDVVNMHTTGGTFVKLEFSVDNVPYVLLRSKDHKEYKTNLKIYVNGEDKSGKGIRDSEKLFAEYLPDLTSSLIGSVIILGQGLPNRFSNNTPSGRKEVLEKLSKSDFMIEDLKNRIAHRKTELQSKQHESEMEASSLQGKQSALTGELAESSAKLLAVKPIDSIIEQIESATNEIQAITSKLAEKTEELEKFRTREKNGKDWYDRCIEEHTTAVNENAEKYHLKTDELSKHLNLLKAQAASLEADIKSKDSVKDTCPTCGQKIIGVTKIDTSADKKVLEDLKYSIDKEECNYNKVTDGINNERNVIESAFIAKKKKYQVTMDEVLAGIRDCESKISIYNAQIANLNKNLSTLTTDKAIHDEAIKSLEEKINSLKTTLSEIAEKILYYKDRTNDFLEHIAAVNKMSTAVTRDFRGYLLTSVIDYINIKAKSYSLDVFGSPNIEFCLDGNNINIIYDGKQYENLSGGERQKVDIVVQLSIRDMLCKFMNFGSNILCVDECFDNLDAEGCQKILTLLSSKLHDVESIYIITHHSDIQIPCDNEIVVAKGADGISYIKRG